MLKYATGAILGMLGMLGQRLISMSKQGVSTVLATILAMFASMLSTISTSMLTQTEMYNEYRAWKHAVAAAAGQPTTESKIRWWGLCVNPE